MEISRQLIGGITILELAGRLVTGPGEADIVTLGNEIQRLAAAGRVNVALHLARLASIDARGLGELVTALKTLRGSGGKLTLIAPSTRVRTLLALTRLDSILPVCDSETVAAGG